MNLLLYHIAAKISGPRLAKWMGLTPVRNAPEERPRALIRYGTGRAVPYRPTLTTLNSRRSLTAYSTRGEQLRLLQQGGVRVPAFQIPGVTAPFPLGNHGIIARDYPRGRQPTQGRGITFYPDGAVLRGRHDLLMAHVPKDRQFRVHVIGGRTRVREVVPTGPIRDDQPVWNLGEGFIYNIPQTPPPPKVTPAAVQAVAALRLDFGAVDVITSGQEAYVLEVNTAPGLADPSLEWYGTHLGRLIGLTPADMPRWDAVEALTENEATLA